MATDWEKEQNRLDAMIAHGYREDVVNNPDFFDAEKGKLKWPAGDGAKDGTEEQLELHIGDKLVRYNTLDGEYFAPADTTFEDLSLPYDESKIEKTYWIVDKPFNVEKSEIAPAFGSAGGGIQYRLNAYEECASEYNEEHGLGDSPSNLAFEGFIHQIEQGEALGEKTINEEQDDMASAFNKENNDENFKKENWSQLSREERLEALQKFENENADADGRGRRDIVGQDMPEGMNGKYEHDENRYEISINNNFLDDPDSDPENAKNTVAHEGRHATQHDVVDGLIDGDEAGIDDELREQLREDFESDEQLDDAQKIEHAQDTTRPSERDAREYAIDKSPEASFSQEDKASYEVYDSLAKENAYAEQSAQDFEAFEQGKQNQYSAGNADEGYSEYQKKVNERLNDNGQSM